MKDRAFKIVGSRFSKAEAFQKATGELKFSGDLTFPGMIHAKILRSPYAHAKVRHIDVSRAMKLLGVKAAITHQDVPKIPIYSNTYSQCLEY